jgi:GT2 family glycosyltransferase
MLASIVVNTYNRPVAVNRCVELLSRQARIDEVEAIVVDDGSDGDFRAIERQWKTKLNFRFIRTAHGGRSASRNRGARAATGERLIFLGDDVFVRPGWLERHLERAGRPDVAVLGPYPLKLGGREGPRYSPPLARRVDSTANFALIENDGDVPFRFFATGNLSMDRERFLAIGGFDERFARYGWEDIDLGYRFARSGGRIVFDRAAEAVHHHPPMTRVDLWRREFDVGFTAMQFWEKWRADDLRYMKFWGERPTPGPAWRRALGRAAIAAVEAVAPNGALLERLYERAVYSHRHAGAAEAARTAETRDAGAAEPAAEPGS